MEDGGSVEKDGGRGTLFFLGDRDREGLTKEGIAYKMWKVKTFSSNPFINFSLKRLNPSNNYRKMYSACADLKADIYHFHDLWINRIAPKIKTLSHEPVVFYDAREPYAEDYRSFYGNNRCYKWVVSLFASWVDRWEKKKALNYDLVIANESKVRERFSTVLGEERAVVLHNYFDPELFASDHIEDMDKVEEKRPYDFLYCGLLTEERGAWNLLAAVNSLKKKNPAIRALLLGKIKPSTLEAEIRAYLREKDLEDHVEIISQVPHDRVGNYYRKSRIGLILWRPIPSLKIKMPIKIFEYMAFGLPVVGSDVGHIGELIETEGCGIAVNSEMSTRYPKRWRGFCMTRNSMLK